MRRWRGARWVEMTSSSRPMPIVMHDDLLKRTTGIDRSPGHPAPNCRPACRPRGGDACFGELGLGCNVETAVRSQPRRQGSRSRPSAAAGQPLLPPCCRASPRPACRRPAIRSPSDRAIRWARSATTGGPAEYGGGRRQPNGNSAHRAARRRSARRATLSVYTINDGDVARALGAMGVDCVITDAPDVILRALG